MSIFKSLASHARAHILYRRIAMGKLQPIEGRKHGLPAELIVSLTSYKARFNTLVATIHCLLAQDVAPDFVILWVSHDDLAHLPKEVERLKSSRFLIEATADTRSYKKIIPCIQRAPRAFILTCDDDVYYPPNWIQTLTDRYRVGSRIVNCNRAHRIRVDANGKPLAYENWEQETDSTEVSNYIFPTGCGGVLYEPGVFHGDVTKAELFEKLCPTADDIWLYWMIGLNGSRFASTGLLNAPICWPSSQRLSLRDFNVPRGGGNDVQIANMIEAYGLPFLGASG